MDKEKAPGGEQTSDENINKLCEKLKKLQSEFDKSGIDLEELKTMADNYSALAAIMKSSALLLSLIK